MDNLESNEESLKSNPSEEFFGNSGSSTQMLTNSNTNLNKEFTNVNLNSFAGLSGGGDI